MNKLRKSAIVYPKEEVTSVFGIYFCLRCKNMMAPIQANGNLLEFNCQTCGIQEIDFSKRYNEDCLLYSKELQTCTPLPM
jgi:DNA-directed RNA polymerase subunit RPC12/RpoP